MSVLGVLLLIMTIGGRQSAQQEAELADLRETNTVVYLARLKECCKTRWVEEVRDPRSAEFRDVAFHAYKGTLS